MQQDAIEQEISINADLELVWELVSVPGWWVPSDAPVPVDRTAGSHTVRTSEKWGSFPVEVVELTPRIYAAFRWASQFPNEELGDGRTTLVEFFISEAQDAVTVRVRESGFAALDASEEVKQSGIKENTKGWREELGALRKSAENRSGGSGE
ncbi:hypothetical protein [Actinospica robiniae]|uniref:hypothetical protein n=1 Tax=Actinospica robiniae TaxID=304901 RepID=UPI0003FEBE22|nr:hypothetical protein [Actinospica robiniae]